MLIRGLRPILTSMRFRHLTAMTLGLLAVALAALTGGDDRRVAAQDDASHINQCVGHGNKGLFSGHSNQQTCNVGFYACVGNPSGDPGFGGLPPGTKGVIMIPWGENWHQTGGNYGYVGNVCNGNAGIANVITYSIDGFINPDQWQFIQNPSFATHLDFIQRSCAGQCEARLMSYWAALQLWSDNTLHIRDDPWSPVDHLSIHYRLVSFYLANGPIYWDGYSVNSTGQGATMGAPGYGALMSQTVLAEGDVDEWVTFKDGIAQKAPDLVAEGLKTVAEIIFIALW
jgi:hypothetical protein